MLNGIAIVAAVATAVSAWMLVGSFGMKGLPGCGAGSGCDALTRGRWSRWGAMPVSGLGFGIYAVLLAAAILARAGVSPNAKIILFDVLTTCTLLAAGSAIWFVLIQALVVRRFCVYCMLVHVCGLVSAGIVFAHLSSWQAGSIRWPIAISSVGLGVFIVGQIILKPKTYAMIPAAPAEPCDVESAPLVEPTVIADLVSDPTWSASNRKLVLFNGRVRLNLDEWPLIGKSDAEHVIVWLFDFTCKECHHLHRLLREAVARFEGRMAVAAVPVPQHPGCNSTIKCYKQSHGYACEYARLGLALWTAAPHRFEQWDAFMAAEEACQPFGLAMLKAKELADLGQFQIRERDPVLDPRLEESVAIFLGANSPKIPSLVLPKGVVAGHIPDVKSLMELLVRHVPMQPHAAVASN